MKTNRNNGGFTLVEFVVTIAIASMITLAATSMLLLGLRIHHTSNTTAATINTVSMMYSIMETIASENEISCTPASYSNDFDPTVKREWKVTQNNKTIINYDGTNISLHDTPFISNVESSNAHFNKANNLLTIYIETEHNNYSFSIYCRKGVT